MDAKEREFGFRRSIHLDPLFTTKATELEIEEADAFLCALSFLCSENIEYIRVQSCPFAVKKSGLN
jgi:hypothetical protein